MASKIVEGMNARVDETERFTVVFRGNVRALKQNPHRIVSDFGEPLIVSVGDVVAEFDELRAAHEEGRYRFDAVWDANTATIDTLHEENNRLWESITSLYEVARMHGAYGLEMDCVRMALEKRGLLE